MSAAAIATLRELWGQLKFARVNRVIAREPEDVLSITVCKDSGHTDYMVKSNRTADIPEADRRRARIAWRHYFGFTNQGVYFQRDDYHSLDCDYDLTMNWGKLLNHTSCFDKPEIGALICGTVMNTPKGQRFNRWFDCPPELKLLIESVLYGTTLSEEELGRRLVTKGHPDKYWAIARLVLFDNVQAFVDMLRPVDYNNDQRPLHPAHGLESGSVVFSSGERLKIEHRGMWLTMDVTQYVHLLSYRLNEPTWWTEFNRLAREQGLEHQHPARGGFCAACDAERDPLDRLNDYSYLDGCY